MQGAWCSTVHSSVTPVTKEATAGQSFFFFFRQDNLEAKLSYIVRRWVSKSGVCLFSDTYKEKKYSVNVTNSYHASQALKI